MKKSRPLARGTATKSRGGAKTVDEYLARVPEPACSTLQKVRTTIRSAVPAETEEVISYGIPAFKHKRVLIWYAAFANHCSLFPTAAVIANFKDELKGYKMSKGTIQFPTDKPFPAPLLKKMVKMRLAEVEGRKR